MFKSTHGDFKSSHYCLSVMLKENVEDNRFELVNALKQRGVGTSVYYPKPVPHMTYYKEKYGYELDSYPVASRISYRSIALPVGPHLDTRDMTYIVEKFKEAIMEVL